MISIKRITAEDYLLATDLFNQYRMFYGKPSDKDVAEKYIKERLSNNESVIFVALEDESGQQVPAGFTQLYPIYSSVSAAKDWILNDLFVDAAHRRKGVGEKLIRAAMDFAKEANARFVQLETGKENVTAQSLYHAIGFIRQDEASQYYLYKIDVQ